MAIRGFGNQNNLQMRLGLNSTKKTFQGEEQSPAEQTPVKPEEQVGSKASLKPIKTLKPITSDNVDSLLVGKGIKINRPKSGQPKGPSIKLQAHIGTMPSELTGAEGDKWLADHNAKNGDTVKYRGNVYLITGYMVPYGYILEKLND